MQVGLFFRVRGQWLFHGCTLEQAEKYGDFLVYPRSHMEVWEECYARKYGVDFDYFPRGRIAYRTADETFLIYHDQCIGDELAELIEAYCSDRIHVGYDEHYQCSRCNRNYVI